MTMLTTDELRECAAQTEKALIEHGDPLSGDDWAMMQVVRAYLDEHPYYHAEPLTDEWLSANGWKMVSPRNDGNTTLPGFRLRPIAHELADNPQPFRSPDDLCIAVAPSHGFPGQWFCWLYKLEPYLHIHLRRLRTVGDLVRIYEGLTGRTFQPKDGV